GKHRHLAFDRDRERFHPLLPSGRKLACAAVVLLESWRKLLIARSVVLPNASPLTRQKDDVDRHAPRVADRFVLRLLRFVMVIPGRPRVQRTGHEDSGDCHAYRSIHDLTSRPWHFSNL